MKQADQTLRTIFGVATGQPPFVVEVGLGVPWWELRLPWETGPRWFQPIRRRRWHRCHEVIARLERELKIANNSLPWEGGWYS